MTVLTFAYNLCSIAAADREQNFVRLSVKATPELSTGRMEPPVGLIHDFAGCCHCFRKGRYDLFHYLIHIFEKRPSMRRRTFQMYE